MCRGLCLNETVAMACTFVGTTIRLSMQLGTLPSVCPGGLDEKVYSSQNLVCHCQNVHKRCVASTNLVTFEMFCVGTLE